jgi:hypothetical protein
LNVMIAWLTKSRPAIRTQIGSGISLHKKTDGARENGFFGVIPAGYRVRAEKAVVAQILCVNAQELSCGLGDR